MTFWPKDICLRIFCLSLLLPHGFVEAQRKPFVFDYITNNEGLTHNTVYDICQDSKGFLWFATELGLNRYDGQAIRQYHYRAEDENSLPAHSVPCLLYTVDSLLFVGTSSGLALYRPETDNFRRISFRDESLGHFVTMEEGFGGELLICTEDKGAFAYDPVNNTLQSFSVDAKLYGLVCDRQTSYWGFSRYAVYRFNRERRLMAEYPISERFFGSSISYIGCDSGGRLWVGTFEHGLFSFDSRRNTFEQLPLCRENKMYYVRTLEESESPDEYWIGSESGLYIINTRSGDLRHYVQSFDGRRGTINDNAVYKIHRSREGLFFTGTYFGGVNVVSTRHSGFRAILPDDKNGSLQGKAISAIAKAPTGDLWMATEDAGIAVFDPQHYRFRHLCFDEKNPFSISSNNVHALLMDGDWCWAGHFMGGISRIRLSDGRARRFPAKAGGLSNNFVFALHFLSPDSILVGHLAGVDVFDKRGERFAPFRSEEFAGAFIYDIFTDTDGRIWFCSYDRGIFIFDRNKPGAMEHYQAGDASGLTSNSIISYCIDARRDVWIGTRDAGMLRYRNGRFEACPPSMLADNVVYGIVEDDEGFFWLSSNKGISRLNFQDSTALHFNVTHGLSGNQHNYKSYFKDGKLIYFGSVAGLTYFDPRSILAVRESPVLYFTALRIFNQDVRPAVSGVLERQIDFTSHLTLTHKQNSFGFDFASISFLPGNINYQYYLEGLEESWSPPSDKKQADYTNIAPGDYVFHLRASDPISATTSGERLLYIRVQPPWWASWYAYALYILGVSGLSYYVYRIYRNRQREKLALTIEKIEKENLKLLHQHKMNFFTYISHEFKTPLSIIAASVEMLASRRSGEENELLQSVKRSAERLLFLVNQLMEFRKIESDHAVVHITRGNVIEFIHRIIDAYRLLFEKKNIQLNMSLNYTRSEVFFDFDKLEKIITNLLTNAIKYTPRNGQIHFSLDVEEEAVAFSIADSGKGISESKRDKIFEVFYSDSTSSDVVESSGIGLALTASLVKLLGGRISLHSEVGLGSRFDVSLPYAGQPEDSGDSATSEDIVLPAGEELQALAMPEQGSREYTLVLAEDNKDLAELLYKNFTPKYRVRRFANGEEAWDYIRSNNPDLLITDIMMPRMSGIELCSKLKTDVNLCHIPVLMLTAKDGNESRLDGLRVGADAYLTKPFSMLELEIRIENILSREKALRLRLKELARFEGFELPAANHDRAFVQKLLAFIQDNIGNSDLDIPFIADTLHLSRSSLHNKMKTIMRMSSSEFINTVRINKARELMADPELSLSEIAFRVGYNDSAYFSRIFKKHSGKTPKEYRSTLRDNAEDSSHS